MVDRAMPVEQIPGNTITIAERSVFTLVTRRQGLKVRATNKCDKIAASIVLTEATGGTEERSGSAINTKRLNVMGPIRGGIFPPEDFAKLDYDVTVTDGGQTFQFAGQLLLN
jgi:hypothetical protein